MGQLINLELFFFSLNFFDIREHFSFGVILSEFLTGQGIHVETSQCDELKKEY